MSKEEKLKIERLYEVVGNSFTCGQCRNEIHPKDCDECPVYCWSHNP